MFRAMMEDEIREKINWLVDDIHSCTAIVQDQAADRMTVLEARARISSNRQEIAELNDKLDEIRKGG